LVSAGQHNISLNFNQQVYVTLAAKVAQMVECNSISKVGIEHAPLYQKMDISMNNGGSKTSSNKLKQQYQIL
jgi:hypothetical protein